MTTFAVGDLVEIQKYGNQESYPNGFQGIVVSISSYGAPYIDVRMNDYGPMSFLPEELIVIESSTPKIAPDLTRFLELDNA